MQPKLKHRIQSLAIALKLWWKGGHGVVTPTQCDSRLAICENCPSRKYIKTPPTCTACGCFLNVKAWLNTSYCDMGHWGPIK